jgi:3'-5' exoribonuclease
LRYIEDFKEDDHIVGHYFCKQKANLKTRAGKTYLSLKLQDKTGVIEAKVWELSNDIQAFDEKDYIKIDGVVLAYQNDLQMKVSKIRRSEKGEYLPEDYVPCTEKDIQSLFDDLNAYIKTVSDIYLRSLLKRIFGNAEIADVFKIHSAAKTMHHSYMGGLLEHTLSVVSICDFLSSKYKHVNRDLLITAAMLHDIGKIYELSPFPFNEYTDEGQLLGHSFLGIELVSRGAAEIANFPAKLLALLKHCLLSHHGEYEYGAAKRPKIIEAYILHCADDADAKIKAFETALSADNTQSAWIGYDKCLERNLRKSGCD